MEFITLEIENNPLLIIIYSINICYLIQLVNSNEASGNHPQFLRNESIRNYIPQIMKIQKGDIVTWINTDGRILNTHFYGLDGKLIR